MNNVYFDFYNKTTCEILGSHGGDGLIGYRVVCVAGCIGVPEEQQCMMVSIF